jgi:beta-lactamase class A
VYAIDCGTEEVLLDIDGRSVLRTASIGKVALLLEIARRIESGEIAPEQSVSRLTVSRVADSGLWQHLVSDELPVVDVATLIGAVSDNLGTNVLLHHIGLEAVKRSVASAELGTVALHDLVRNQRTADHPPTLSSASAADLARLFMRLQRGDVLSTAVSALVLHWLGAGCDLSMVASAFNLDPLAHLTREGGVLLCNKTGTDSGIRADAGVVAGPTRSIGYAAVANWASWRPELRDPVMERMNAIGSMLVAAVNS